MIARACRVVLPHWIIEEYCSLFPDLGRPACHRVCLWVGRHRLGENALASNIDRLDNMQLADVLPRIAAKLATDGGLQ
jgi:hypothetical protein